MKFKSTIKTFFFASFLSLSLSLAAQAKIEIENPTISQYLALQQKLASDQKLTPEDTKNFESTALLSKSGKLLEATAKLSAEKDIAGQRKAFKAVSTEVIAYAEKEKIKGLYKAYCPMADANWLQSAEAVKNPYYGSRMLSCGSSEILL